MPDKIMKTLSLSLFLILMLCFSLCKGFKGNSCIPRYYGSNSFVCVCNMTYCDDLEPIINSEKQPLMYETSKAGSRFKKTNLKFVSKVNQGVPTAIINDSEIYQFVLGFGGAFTDASGINLKLLPLQIQETIIKNYFSKYGLEYNMGRVPIASCDFSSHPYSYDDSKDDFGLKHFSLAKEDYLYKIPYILKAASLSPSQLLLVGSPWSAPAWMKTNNAMNGKGKLKGNPGGKYYQTWADYFVRFLKAYQNNSISFWGITMQNEPTDGCLANFSFQAMCFTAEEQRDFLKLNLGPTLKKAGYGTSNLRLMIMDDVRLMLPKWADIVLSDPAAAHYVSGIAFHWYYEDFAAHKLLDITHSKYPGMFYLSTEACTGSYPWEISKVSLGNWDRAERYAHDIIQDLLNWSVGWIDWNLVLDMKGGPNWVQNFVDAPIIANPALKEFYKQPMYYVLAHFSKLLVRGSYRIGLHFKNGNPDKCEMAAFKTPKDQIVVIVLNRGIETVPLILHDISKGFLNVTVNANSIQSYIW